MVEQFKQESGEDKLDGLFGKLSKWNFLAMAVSSLIGGILYYRLKETAFLYTALLRSILFIGSAFYLPNGRATFNKSRKLLDKNEILLILRKFGKHRRAISVYIVYGLFFQVIIQYWQVMVYDFNLISENGYWLGFILCLLMLAQSAAGKVTEAKLNITGVILHFSAITVLCGLIAAVYYSFPVLYIIGLCLIMFAVRYVSIIVAAELQADLKNRFRAKYDMGLNSLLRMITAITLFVVGFLADAFGAVVILYLGIGLLTINLLTELFGVKKNDD